MPNEGFGGSDAIVVAIAVFFLLGWIVHFWSIIDAARWKG